MSSSHCSNSEYYSMHCCIRMWNMDKQYILRLQNGSKFCKRKISQLDKMIELSASTIFNIVIRIKTQQSPDNCIIHATYIQTHSIWICMRYIYIISLCAHAHTVLTVRTFVFQFSLNLFNSRKLMKNKFKWIGRHCLQCYCYAIAIVRFFRLKTWSNSMFAKIYFSNGNCLLLYKYHQ